LKNLSILFFLSLVFYACGPAYVYEEEYQLPEEGWPYSDTLAYAIDITDTLSRYNLLMKLEHTIDYPFQNIYLQIHTSYPNGKTISDRLSINLLDTKGQWFGKCRNENCELLIGLQEGLYFDQVGIHTIAVEQYMRRNPLPGIRSAGLMLEKAIR
jgi:gliding motility-associated lipoprotein GldH